MEAVIEILAPPRQTVPLIFASPHSGSDYSPSFLASSKLDALTLRRSEDCFVDELFARVPELGAPLLKARFPRAFLDPNREPFELDPTMFADPLPDFVNHRSPRVRIGLGTIARIVASGEEIYARKLQLAEALERIERLYRPYHRALNDLLAATLDRFGCYLLIDCHSMPSASQGSRDIVLGDAHGTSCHPLVTQTAHRLLAGRGYGVVRNIPYAGGFTTTHYGKPAAHGHCLQIELSRGLYMDERRFEKTRNFARLAADMHDLAGALAALAPAALEERGDPRSKKWAATSAAQV
ncbi:MAG TPA: N-formylglutamate amidohydrolase [Stellaceae bacterium]|nr:N-formylglutamate amidohydrolase [Stellaceae bacterium]